MLQIKIQPMSKRTRPARASIAVRTIDPVELVTPGNPATALVAALFAYLQTGGQAESAETAAKSFRAVPKTTRVRAHGSRSAKSSKKTPPHRRAK
jgi:hypothetical protein